MNPAPVLLISRFLIECFSSMSSAPPHSEDPDAIRRRRRSDRPVSGWKAIPLGIKVLAVICLLVLAIVPFARQRTWVRSEKITEVPATDTGYVPGLVVTEASVDRKSRTLKGIVTNGTDKTIDDVTVTYFVRDSQAAEAGEI